MGGQPVPYEIRKQGDKYCVYKKDTGENTGCSDSREMAIKHMQALYVHSGDKAKAVGPTDGCDCFACVDMRKEYTVIDEPQGTSSEGILDKVKALLGVKQEPAGNSQIVLTKEASGRTRVLLRVSNIFKDRHGEIITEAAHKEYESYVKESGQYPEFWLWHTPGSRWGQADLVSYDDGFLTMSGLVDVGKEYIAESLASLGKDIGVSHGFKYLKLGEDSIDWYRTFEASPLPVSEAANVWTGMMLAEKEWSMGLAEKKRKFFEVMHVPSDVIADWDRSSKSLSQLLKEAGIEYKDLEPEPDPPDPPAPQPDPAPAPAPQATPAVAMGQQANSVNGTDSTAILEALNKMNSRFDSLESAQKALEEKVKDSVASTMAAAIVPGGPAGAGVHVASKQGEAPSDTQQADVRRMEEEGLVAFITGGGR